MAAELENYVNSYYEFWWKFLKFLGTIRYAYDVMFKQVTNGRFYVLMNSESLKSVKPLVLSFSLKIGTKHEN